MNKKEFISSFDNAVNSLIDTKGEMASCPIVEIVSALARLRYGEFVEKCLEGFYCNDRLEHFVYKRSYLCISPDEQEVMYFLRSLLLLQFKEHCLETKLYEQF